MAKNSSTVKINNCARKKNILLKLSVLINANMLGLDEKLLKHLREMFTYIVTQLKFLTQSQQFELGMKYLSIDFTVSVTRNGRNLFDQERQTSSLKSDCQDLRIGNCYHVMDTFRIIGSFLGESLMD